MPEFSGEPFDDAAEKDNTSEQDDEQAHKDERGKNKCNILYQFPLIKFWYNLW